MALIEIAGKSFLVGDVVKIERHDNVKAIIRIERILNSGQFQYWDVLTTALWEGVSAIVAGGVMDPKDVRVAWKAGTISDRDRDAYTKFAMMYHRMRDWEKLLS